MKTSYKIVLLLAGLTGAALPFINAADAGAAPAPAAAAAGKHPRLRAMMQRKAVRQRIAHRLGLSADQVSQLKAARGKTVASVKSIRGDASLTTEQKKAKVRETMQAARGEMRGVLTPDQQEKFGKMRAHLRGMRRGKA